MLLDEVLLTEFIHTCKGCPKNMKTRKGVVERRSILGDPASLGCGMLQRINNGSVPLHVDKNSHGNPDCCLMWHCNGCCKAAVLSVLTALAAGRVFALETVFGLQNWLVVPNRDPFHLMACTYWEFPKIEETLDMDPEFLGSLIQGPQNRTPNF